MHSPQEVPPRAAPSDDVGRRWLVMMTLIVAGEAIFFLPFVIARVFRPTLLEVFAITNWELGMAFSAYGVVAMLSYFPGGPLADRFDARKLLVLALLGTAIGGLVMASTPNLNTLIVLYAFWGLTTVLVFWSALIRATRRWGGQQNQGSAFGLLDGGRGFVAAAVGSITVYIFDALLPVDIQASTLSQRSVAFEQVILIFTGIVFVSAAMVWWALPKASSPEPSIDTPAARNKLTSRDQPAMWGGVRYAVSTPTVWLQAVIIVAAYVAYKGLDDVSLYAKEALGFDEVAAAYTSTLSMWMRPPAAILTGWFADRYRATSVTIGSFLVLALGSLVIASGLIQPGMVLVFLLTMVSTSAAVFALRGLYFALMREGRVPFPYTGSVVGFVSAIGYTPDVFMGPLMGYLLDRSPGPVGHQHVFAVLAIFSMIGLIATCVFQILTTRRAPFLAFEMDNKRHE